MTDLLTRRPRPWRRTLLTVTALLVAVAFTLLGTPRAAWAHNGLIDTSPGDGKTVATPPKRVVLTFNEPAIATGTKVIVTGPAGSATDGDPQLVDNTVGQDLQRELPAGKYTVEWRVTSADGHPINGEFTFSVRKGTVTEKSASPSAPRATPSSGPTGPAASATATVTPSPTAATPLPDVADGEPGGGPGWLWLLVAVPVGLAAALGWRFSRR